MNGQSHRHHAIYVDVERLLDVARFRQRFLEILEKISPAPALVVAPPHRAGRTFAALACEILAEKHGRTISRLEHRDLSPESQETPKDLLAKLTSEDVVMLVDDVSVTGDRLARYRAGLRELRCRARVSHVIGVARPSSETQWQLNLKNWRHRPSYGHKLHTVDAVEKVILPDWDETECPWCKEVRTLREIYERPDIKPLAGSLVSRRIRALQLSQSTTGLVDNALWHTVDGNALSLTVDSIFLEYRGATEADTIAAVAAALQQMRTRQEDRLELSYPYVVMLDSDDYFGRTTFTDVILHMAILRAAKVSELKHWRDELEALRRQKSREYLLMDVKEGDTIRLEMCVAVMAGKAPRPDLSDGDWEMLDSRLSCRDFVRCVLPSRHAGFD